MSFFPGKDPAAGDTYQCDAIAQVIVPRTVDLGDFAVRRALPSARTRMVGPFIFFDHFGPAEFRAGNGLDVRPHPHIGLATVTYLFDGEIMHRDSLGTAVAIKPGEVNWMTAGRGIVHSERTRPERRVDGEPIHGLQMWVALPAARRKWRLVLRTTRPPNSRWSATMEKTCAWWSARFMAPLHRCRLCTRPSSRDVHLKAAQAAARRRSRGTRCLSSSAYIDISGDKFEAGRLLVFRPATR